MLIGIPKKLQKQRNRVGLTPAGVQSSEERTSSVVETNAGLGLALSMKIRQTRSDYW